MLLGKGLINCRILYLKLLRLFELGIDISRFFHSIIAERKKRIFEKLVFKVKTIYIV